MKSFNEYITERNLPIVGNVIKGFKSRRRGEELTRNIKNARDSYNKLKRERARGDLSQAESNPNPMRWSSESEGEISAIDKLHKLNRELRHHRSGTPLSPEQRRHISLTTPTPEDLKQLNLFSKQSGISGRNRSFTLYPNRRT